MSAREVDGDVVFLHRLVPGPASRSYGVAVAKLAGLPESVLARARAVLAGLEGGEGILGGPSGRPSGARARDNQLDLFAPSGAAHKLHEEVIETIRAVDVDRLTPLEALSLIARLKQRL